MKKTVMPGLDPGAHGAAQPLDVDARIESGHDEIGRNKSIVSRQPRRITIDEAVDGLAQPRLALTSTSFTWRQPPSR